MPVASNPSDVFGPMLLGAFLNAFLYGVSIIQGYIYFQSPRSRNDPPWFKYLIIYLLIADTANTVIDIGIVYQPLVLNFWSQKPITPILLRADAVVTAFLSTPVQLFMGWRVGSIAKSKILPAIIYFLACTSFAGGLWATIEVSFQSSFARALSMRTAIGFWLTTSALTDVLITICFVSLLTTQRSGLSTVFEQYVSKMMRLSIQTGAITSLVALTNAMVFLARPDSTVIFIWGFMLAKLYSNSLLFTLNCRPSISLDESQFLANNVQFADLRASYQPTSEEVEKMAGIVDFSAQTFGLLPPQSGDIEHGQPRLRTWEPYLEPAKPF